MAHFHECVSLRVMAEVAMQGILIRQNSITQKAVSGEYVARRS